MLMFRPTGPVQSLQGSSLAGPRIILRPYRYMIFSKVGIFIRVSLESVEIGRIRLNKINHLPPESYIWKRAAGSFAS